MKAITRTTIMALAMLFTAPLALAGGYGHGGDKDKSMESQTVEKKGSDNHKGEENEQSKEGENAE